VEDIPVIVGGGLAGLMTALSLAPQKAIVLAKAPLTEGAASAWAQGGIAAALGEDDSPGLHTAATGESRRPVATRLSAPPAVLGIPPGARARCHQQPNPLQKGDLIVNVPSLPAVMLEPLVRSALLEDLGRAGDITTDSVVPAQARARTALVARQPGVVAGLDLAALTFRLVAPEIEIEIERPDGTRLQPGDVIATIEGPARGVLTAERVALNFLGHLSGVATATSTLVDAVKGHKARISCTRKTMPGLRAVQKYAVRVGGGVNHRLGLDDAILIKDNHVVAAGGLKPAILAARNAIGHMVKIEVEVDTLAQLKEVLAVGVDAILLDNMGPEMLAEAVQMIDGRAISEASGRITPATAPAIAAAGVDLISAGWLTHSASVLDIGLDWRQ
jgi:nicotinate-nucleotide pyrophosphorylase (carboxylating)